uniref:Uncharacterized protein n=1 Tax=Ditylenchus dipsaci TaxID=166011 RepID=A0A915CX51_9BILA
MANTKNKHNEDDVVWRIKFAGNDIMYYKVEGIERTPHRQCWQSASLRLRSDSAPAPSWSQIRSEKFAPTEPEAGAGNFEMPALLTGAF